MKYLSIGKIIDLGAEIYEVSLFNGSIFELIGTKEELLTFLKETMTTFFEKGESSGASIDFYNDKGRKHHIMFDQNGEDGDPVVFESTMYEYLTSHKPFLKSKKYRSIINERRYSFKDISRVSSHWKVWWTRTLLSVVSAIFLFAFIHQIASLGVIQSNDVSNKTKIYVMLYGIFSLVLCFLMLLTSFISSSILYKKLTEAKRNYESVEWGKYKKIRLLSMYIIASLSIFASIFSLQLLLIIIKDILPQKSLSGNELLILFSIFILSLSLFIFLFTSISIFRTHYITLKRLKYFYTNVNERKSYKNWLWKNGPNIFKSLSKKEDYILDLEPSELSNFMLINSVNDMLQKYTKEEIKEHKKKTKEHLKISIQKYLALH